MAVLAPPPVRTPISGDLPGTWVVWFQKLYDRVGGPISLTLVQIADELVTVEADITAIDGQITALQTNQTALTASVAAVSASQAVLASRLSAIEAQLAAGISGTIATAKLTVGGTDGSMTFTNGLLTAETPAT